MKNFNELTNYEKITLSVDEIGLDEETRCELHNAGIHVLGPIIAVDEYVECGVSIQTAKKVIDHSRGLGIILTPKKNSVDDYDYNEDEENPYEIMYDIIQNELFERARSYKATTGINIMDELANLNLPDDLYTKLADVGYESLLAFFLHPSVVFTVNEKMRENEAVFYEARKYISQTYGIPEKLFVELDELSEKARQYE